MPDINRVIQLTGPGISALATVRLIGPGVESFLAAYFSRVVPPGSLVHGRLRDAAGVIDDPVAARSADGLSLDLTLHGGAWVVQAAIDCATRAGFTFTPSGDMGHEMISDARDEWDGELQLALPRARTARAAKRLFAQPDLWRAWWTGRPTADEMRAALADRSLHHLLHPPSVAIVGLPNAGKSTLANCLFGIARSIVSPIAGTTRDWVGEEANLDGLIVQLLDTPGRHATTDVLEHEAITKSEQPIARADLVIVLLDAARPWKDQSHLMNEFSEPLIVLNKLDERCDDWAEQRMQALAATPIVARVGEGVETLVREILRRFGVSESMTRGPSCWTLRQRLLLQSRLKNVAYEPTERN